MKIVKRFFKKHYAKDTTEQNTAENLTPNRSSPRRDDLHGGLDLIFLDENFLVSRQKLDQSGSVVRRIAAGWMKTHLRRKTKETNDVRRITYIVSGLLRFLFIFKLGL